MERPHEAISGEVLSNTARRSSGRNRTYQNMTKILRGERFPVAKRVCITRNISLAVYIHYTVMQELESLASYRAALTSCRVLSCDPKRRGSRLGRNDTTCSMIRARFRIDIKLHALQVSYL
jgi:hypothetical protein